ncbi:c-type cytochrome [Aquimarina sp. ERC-38]|uniref:cytochrome-c peroxidase n=1 Tax=Aquimarina sp. ERC-38 TaxID=2949996 RepID=UPI002246F57A|nr:cytochrome c peroxidase [Aquimarina sp. ERC-38]UZO80360.1 c-type cytochrome [Aquimarina sp. ERC-38]
MYTYIKKWKAWILLWSSCLAFIACQTDDDTYVSVTEVDFTLPENFPESTYDFDKNPITKNGFALGKKLFFDPILSKDGSVSCNNCHQQSRAFADLPLHPLSIGVNDSLGDRNAPALFNLAFRKEFFFDGGVTHLDFVPINAIESEVEMASSMKVSVERLEKHDEYPELFKKAFGTDSVTSPRILLAFSQFLNAMISDQSRFDQYQRGDTEVLSKQELDGKAAFDQKCASCHSGILFTDQTFRNNGISDTFSDPGRALISESAEDLGKFMVPSLRNIEVTAPYMHNASFNSLEEVLEHYATGVKYSETLDPEFQKNPSKPGIDLSPQEQKDIISFLKSLTDDVFLTNPKFRNNP